MEHGRGDRGARMSLVVGSSDPKGSEKKAKALATIFEKRKLTLKKKALELATLCAVPVAVVAVLPGGGGEPDVWESEEGVLDKYRALPAEKRAEHTHEKYLEDQLGKVTAKLARMQQNGPPALTPPDLMLSRMSLEELRALLVSVDAALLATAKRKRALGLPDEAVVEPLCIGGNLAVGSDEYQMHPPTTAAIYEIYQNPAMLDAYAPYSTDHQLIPETSGVMQLGYSGYTDDQQMIPEPNMMPPAGFYSYNTGLMHHQPTCNAQHIGGSYTLQNQVTGNGDNHHGMLASASTFQPLNAAMPPTDFASFCMEGYQMAPQGKGSFAMEGYQMAPQGKGSFAMEGHHAAAAYHPIPNHEDWRNDAMELAEAEHHYMGMSSNHVCTPAPYAAQVHRGNLNNPPAAAFCYMGGAGGNVDGREMQCSSNDYQYSGEASQYSSTNEEIHYPIDATGASRQYWEN